MVLKGNVKNGVIVLEDGVDLSDGTEVPIQPKDRFGAEIIVDGDADSRQPEKKAPLAKLAEIAKQFPADEDWPEDGASQTDHHLYGTPQRNG